jgi:hypothetical protein
MDLINIKKLKIGMVIITSDKRYIQLIYDDEGMITGLDLKTWQILTSKGEHSIEDFIYHWVDDDIIKVLPYHEYILKKILSKNI